MTSKKLKFSNFENSMNSDHIMMKLFLDSFSLEIKLIRDRKSEVLIREKLKYLNDFCKIVGILE